jgi:hypothetical protein
MIRLSCPGCKKKLAVGDHLAGRIVVCPECKGKARVPKPAPPAVQPAEAVEALEEVEELEEVEDVLPARPQKTGIKPAPGQAGPRRPAGEDEDRPRRRPRDDYEDEDDRPRRRRRPKPRRIRLKSESGEGIFSEGIFGMEIFSVVIIGLALLAVPLLALCFVPGFGVLFILLAGGLGSLMAIGGGVWLLIVAFSEDSTTGFLCLFVPFYMFYFVLTEFETCRRPFLVYGLGMFLLLGARCAAGPGPGGYNSFGPPRRFGALPGPQPVSVASLPAEPLA